MVATRSRSRRHDPRHVARRAPAPPATGHPVGRALTIALAALLLAALLSAESLDATARAQPFGWRRDVGMAASGPLLDVSEALGLTGPRRALEDLLDRPSSGRPTGPSMPAPTIPPVTTVPTTTAPGPSTSRPPSTTTTTAPAVRTPTPEDPLRLWVAGDSMTEAFGPALVDGAEATGVVEADRDLTYSSGLTRPDFFDWYAASVTAIAEHDPEVIVVMLGANDAQGIVTATGPARFGTDPWIAEYRARVAALMDLLGADGRVVYWVGLPIMRSTAYGGRMQVLNGIYREEAERRAGPLRFIDTWALFTDANGGYNAYLPGADGQPVLVRRTDGIHLTEAGADRLATVVLDTLTADARIR
jgi:hypothetical protein